MTHAQIFIPMTSIDNFQYTLAPELVSLAKYQIDYEIVNVIHIYTNFGLPV